MQSGQQALLGLTMLRYKLDVCALSETRIPEDGTENIAIPNSDECYTLYFSGNPKGGSNGVGFALTKEANKSVIGWNPVSDRLAILRLCCKPIHVSLLAVYAPTNAYDDAEKDLFYEELEDVKQSARKIY